MIRSMCANTVGMITTLHPHTLWNDCACLCTYIWAWHSLCVHMPCACSPLRLPVLACSVCMIRKSVHVRGCMVTHIRVSVIAPMCAYTHGHDCAQVRIQAWAWSSFCVHIRVDMITLLCAFTPGHDCAYVCALRGHEYTHVCTYWWAWFLLGVHTRMNMMVHGASKPTLFRLFGRSGSGSWPQSGKAL